MNESNPILSRINNIKLDDNNLSQKTHIYKPPVRAYSNVRKPALSTTEVNKKTIEPELSEKTYTTLKKPTYMDAPLSDKKTDLLSTISGNISESKNVLKYKPPISNRLNETTNLNFTTESTKEVLKTLKKDLTYQTLRRIDFPTEITRITNLTDNDQKHDTVINLEDLLLLEEKLSDIINNICFKLETQNVCFEWWNLYYNCSLCWKFHFYFKDELSKQIIKDYSILELISIMICYHSPSSTNLDHIIKSIFSLLHKNFLVLCDYILSKISSDSMSNVWVFRLRNLLNSKLQIKLRKNQHIYEIRENNQFIYDSINIMLKNLEENEIIEALSNYVSNIHKITPNILNDFFRSRLLRVANRNASVLASVLLSAGEKLENLPFPYIKIYTKKEYTLVLDLDETLIHFKLTDDDNKGILRLRPGIYDFLESVRVHYELIIFTASTQDVINF